MDNPEKLATLGTQDIDKQNQKHNTIWVRHNCTQANTNNVNKTGASYKQLEVKMKRLYEEFVTDITTRN